MRWIIIAFTFSLFCLVLSTSKEGMAADFMVYSVFRELNLGNPEEVSQKDFYVNIGSSQGVHEGTILEVMRRVSTYDLLSEQLYRDVIFPIAFVKVIHVEPTASIARLEKIFPADKTPVFTPRSVIVGDLVRIANSN